MDHGSFVEICLHALKMSAVHDGERLVVLTQGDQRIEYADAFIAAGRRLGANIYHMRLPAAPAPGVWAVGDTGLATMPEAVEALKAADMVIDCIFLLFSAEQMAIQAAGTRILTVVEPPELLARMMPNPELREKVEMAAEILANAKVMRITSPHGTDVIYKLNTYPDRDGVRVHRPAGPLGPLAIRLRVYRRRRRRRGRANCGWAG